jgi:hypothetical protein
MRSVEAMTARWAMRRCRDADRHGSVTVLSVVDTSVEACGKQAVGACWILGAGIPGNDNL